MSRPSAERRRTKRIQRRPPRRPAKNRRQRTPPEPARPPRQRHRQITPPTRSAKSLRQRTPPSRAAREREAKSGNRRRPKHPDRSLPILASKRVDQSRGEPALPLGTPPTRSAKQVRQLTPPTHTANSHRQLTPPSHTASQGRQSETANQRAPSKERQPPGTQANRPEPASPRIKAGWSVPYRTRTAAGDTAKEVRQAGPPDRDRQAKGTNQRAPTAGNRSTST